jgi:CHAD domain-containing protein
MLTSPVAADPPPVTVEAVARRIAHDLVAELVETEAAALEDRPDGVHRHRTQVRRLRGALAAMRGLLDAEQTAALEVALREWGSQLGEVRDAEVRASVAEEALVEAGFDDDEAARARLVDAERAGYARLHARLVDLRALPRARRRDARVRDFGAAPAVLVPDAEAVPVFERLLHREVRRVRRAARRLDGSMDRYHDLRKAGRRLRYLAEAVDAAEPALFGPALADLGAAGKRVHDLLGEHRDELLFAERLDRARIRAARAGESTLPYDELADAARERAHVRLAKTAAAVRRVRDAARALHPDPAAPDDGPAADVAPAPPAG